LVFYIRQGYVMSHVVCLLKVEQDRAIFTWSEGPASFQPYTLDGMVYKKFQKVASKTREKLANLVKDYLDAPSAMPQSALELAEAGYELYQTLFKPGADQARPATQVRQWLEKLAQQHEVDTLEIVVESPWSLPWNIVYDQPPDKAAFLVNDDTPERWQPFWGLRYNLAGGRKVDPLRRMPLLQQPKVLLVIDPDIRDGLLANPDQQFAEQYHRFAEFAARHNFRIVHNKDELQTALADQRPNLLYWLSHAHADALVLAGDEISPELLSELLSQDDDESFGGLAFLNACQTAERGEEGSFFEAFHNVGFAGMIGTEHQTVDTFAHPLGLDFLEAFLERGEPVGSVLRKLRGRVPLGLLYGSYCPPDIRVDQGSSRDNLEIQRVHVPGVALSAGRAAPETAARALPPLPVEPYPSLAYYDRADRALFAGREDDIHFFAKLLDDAATRILVLHGESGVGKSSFLRAGVIPYLEEECLGYRFMHDRKADGATNTQPSVIFIRATNDLIGQLAQALCEFCARPYEYRTPLGEIVSADLPGLLRDLVGEEVNPGTVRAVLRSDPTVLGRILGAIGDSLPFTATLIIDQGEEVFTLAQTPDDQQRGRQALDMLRRTVGVSGDFKLIFCLRTEYYGRCIDRLRRGLDNTSRIREYLLTDFDENSLTEAIRRPTADGPIPYASEVPFGKYGFRYGPGVAEEIAKCIVRHTTQRRDSVLPLMQVICTQLYGLARARPDKTITLADLEDIGGIEGGMRKHVESLLMELLQGHPSDQEPVETLFTQLYLRQPDGTLTTALLAETEVRQRWTGRMAFGELLAACNSLRLLRVNNLRIGMDEERRYVSLGHDALARIAAHWDEELSRRAQKRKTRKRVITAAGIALVFFALAALGRWKWIDIQAQRRERGLVETMVVSLITDDLDELPQHVKELQAHLDWAIPLLKKAIQEAGDDPRHSKQKLRASLALAGCDPQQADVALDKYLLAQLLAAHPEDVRVIRQFLAPHKDFAVGELRKTIEYPLERVQRLRAASGLVLFAPSDPTWGQWAHEIARDLLSVPSFELKAWTENLRPVGKTLAPELERVCKDRAPKQTADRAVAAAVLAEYWADEPDRLAEVALVAENDREFQPFVAKLRTSKRPVPALLAETLEQELPLNAATDKQHSARSEEPAAAEDQRNEFWKRQANAGVCLLELNEFEQVRDFLKYSRNREQRYSEDPSLRSYLIQRLGVLGTSPVKLGELLSQESDVGVRQGLILALGDCDAFKFTASDKRKIGELVAALFRSDPDSGVHCAAWWMLRNQLWNPTLSVELPAVDRAASRARADAHNSNWFINCQGQTFAIVDPPHTIQPGIETTGKDSTRTHRFAIATTEVTVAQFHVFRPDQTEDTDIAHDPECPMNQLTWYDAAAYCNWLTDRENENRPETDHLRHCYLPWNVGDTTFDNVRSVTIPADFLERTGYRLPTETEWDYVCKAGARTTYSFGMPRELLGRYAWFASNSESRTWPVGQLRPNALGSFDMHGNIWEWCHDAYGGNEVGNTGEVSTRIPRVLRGGSFASVAQIITYPNEAAVPDFRELADFGFRPARTYP
jgi:formylglycine-generating enzyme required for sulfatase activity